MRDVRGKPPRISRVIQGTSGHPSLGWPPAGARTILHRPGAIAAPGRYHASQPASAPGPPVAYQPDLGPVAASARARTELAAFARLGRPGHARGLGALLFDRGARGRIPPTRARALSVRSSAPARGQLRVECLARSRCAAARLPLRSGIREPPPRPHTGDLHTAAACSSGLPSSRVPACVRRSAPLHC